jgi:hypothetical protein
MSFELANAFATFQVYINKALRELINVTCVVYINNILIYNNDLTKHWRYVRQMLERLREYSLYVNLKKCKFNITKIEFLNFIIFSKDVQIELKKN